MSAINNPLVKLLLELKVLVCAPAPAILLARSESPIRALALMNLLNEKEAISAVAAHLRIPQLDLDQRGICDSIPLEAVSKVDPQHLWNYKLLPLKIENETILCACANPLEHDALKTIQFATSKTVKVAIAEETKIAKFLTEFFFATNDSNDLKALEELPAVEVITQLSAKEVDIVVGDANLPPIIKLCNKILSDAVVLGASDIHVEPSAYGMEVRYRIDGVMTHGADIAKNSQPSVLSRFKLLAGMDIAEKRRPQDGRLRVQVSGENVDLRASCIPAADGEKMVFRLLRSDFQALNLSTLAFPPKIEISVKRALSGAGRLLVVTGPTGSGKTTTLYAFLNHLKDGASNIVTVEDPIEYRIAGINQIQINSSLDVSFASVLRSVLRQDPDVIMIGEIRDAETAQIALQAAQTGHFVLSTLHTNDAPAAITRLLNLGCDPHSLATSVAGTMAQRLVRKVCAACATSPSSEYLQKYSEWIGQNSISPDALKVGRGCEQCRNTGYKGRAAIYSYLEINSKVSELIQTKAPINQIVSEAKQRGYIDLNDASLQLIKDGVATFDEVIGYLSFASENPEAAKNSQPTSTSLRKERIVLIEDDADVRSVLSMLLQKEMFEVVEASNGLEGLEKIYANPPSLVLCDLMMPVMDGKEFLQKMRNNKNTQAIPVVILTAVDNEANEVGLLELGAKDFVSKTSSSQVLLARVRKAMAS